jgi:hypothetical protein
MLIEQLHPHWNLPIVVVGQNATQPLVAMEVELSSAVWFSALAVLSTKQAAGVVKPTRECCTSVSSCPCVPSNAQCFQPSSYDFMYKPVAVLKQAPAR